MLDALKRLIAREPEGTDLRAVAAWAKQRGAQFKRVRDGDGFVIEGELEGRDWRIEWGPSQRSYIIGRELRLRMELGVTQDLQMLVLSRPLMAALETETFEHYTAQMQTQIDVSTPEEMRWLVMFPKVTLAAKDLKKRFGAVASVPTVAAAWIDGPLSAGLAGIADGLHDEIPFVLMTLRGRLYLRTELAEPDIAVVESMLRLFETAATQALHVAGGPLPTAEDPGGASTAWQTRLEPDAAQDDTP